MKILVYFLFLGSFLVNTTQLTAQTSKWQLAAEKFNHFNIVLYNYMNANNFLATDNPVSWDAARVKEFASYYYGDTQGLKQKVQELYTAMYALVSDKGLAATPELYKEALSQLYAMGLLDAPRGLPCHKALQQGYFDSLCDHLNVLNTQLELGLTKIHEASLANMKAFETCVQSTEGND